MRKVAVIIKHPYRDFDYRVDIMEIDEKTTHLEVKRYCEMQMLGPFEVIAISERIDFNREFDSEVLKKVKKIN